MHNAITCFPLWPLFNWSKIMCWRVFIWIFQCHSSTQKPNATSLDTQLLLSCIFLFLCFTSIHPFRIVYNVGAILLTSDKLSHEKHSSSSVKDFLNTKLFFLEHNMVISFCISFTSKPSTLWQTLACFTTWFAMLLEFLLARPLANFLNLDSLVIKWKHALLLLFTKTYCYSRPQMICYVLIWC